MLSRRNAAQGIVYTKEEGGGVPSESGAAGSAERDVRVWIDLDNAPHAPFFRPLVRALEERGCSVFVTARRDATAELARQLGLTVTEVGGWRGNTLPTKVAATAVRSAQLARLRELADADVAVSHGSRPLLLAAALRRIPAVTLYDYEGVSSGLFHRLSSVVLVPELLPEPKLPAGTRLARYPGLKEEVYVAGFRPGADVRATLDIPEEAVLVLLRPESETAHYRAQSDPAILEAVLDRIASTSSAVVVLLPRTAAQERAIRKELERRGVRVVVPRPMDGRELVWAADLVISGGGTMTREAAVLGVPAYSIFRGALGAVDRRLAEAGDLVLVRAVQDVDRVRVEHAARRDPGSIPDRDRLPGLLADHIRAAAERSA